MFVYVESKVEHPMVRLSLFRIRDFWAGNLAGFLAAVGRGGLQFILVIWLQGVWLPLHGVKFADTPLQAGLDTLPMMAGRIDSFYRARPDLKEFAPEGIVGELKRLHYDTANATSAPAIAALLKLVSTSQITYGTDYPYFPLGQIASLRQMGFSP